MTCTVRYPAWRSTLFLPTMLIPAAFTALMILGQVDPVHGDELADLQSVVRQIAVTGEGSVSAKPDMATINTGVVTEAKTAAEALAENNAAMQRLLEVLTSHGVSQRDIQTANFNVSPMYHHDPRSGQPPEIKGYRVTNQVRVRVRKLPRLGEVLDALVSAGSNQINGVGFSIAEPDALLDRARLEAVRNARRQADLFARAADVRLGRLLSLRTSPAVRPVPQFQMMAREAARVPIAEGELELSVRVDVVYSIVDED